MTLVNWAGNSIVKKHVFDRLCNFLIVFLSYVLAVLIRYYLFRPDNAINPFSAPYLIITFIYSTLMAVSLDYDEFPRTVQGNEMFSGIYQIIAKNAIGCLVLASVFFVTGIVNFSRWALFLFWIFSSVGLIVKRITVYSEIARKRCAGQDISKVLIVGEGTLAEEYIRAITNNPQFGVRIVGYYGSDNRFQTNLDGWFEPEKYPFPEVNWLGEYSVDKIKENGDIDEIVVADLTDRNDSAVINELLHTGGKVSLLMPHSRFISHGSVTRDLGDVKLIRANEDVGGKRYSKAGLVISVALLLIILLAKKFNLSSADLVYTRAGIEKIRSLLFAVFGFFLFWVISDKLGGTKRGLIKSAGITLLCCILFILVYELIFPAPYWTSVLVDLVPTVIVVGIFFGIKEAIKMFAQSFAGE